MFDKEAEMMRLLRKNGACMTLLQLFRTMEAGGERATGRDAEFISADFSEFGSQGGIVLPQLADAYSSCKIEKGGKV
jgi:hypothetical protein